MRKLLGATLLVTALACSTYAGVMQNPGPENTPSSAPGVITNDAPGIPNDVDGVMPNGVAATSDIQAIEFTLGMLQSILPALF